VESTTVLFGLMLLLATIWTIFDSVARCWNNGLPNEARASRGWWSKTLAVYHGGASSEGPGRGRRHERAAALDNDYPEKWRLFSFSTTTLIRPFQLSAKPLAHTRTPVGAARR